MSRKRGSSGDKPKKPKVTLGSNSDLGKKDTSLDERYGENWEKISTRSRVICPVCCWCLVRTATLTHHANYIDPITGELLLDLVVLGDDIFPVCKTCHSVLHSNKYFIKPATDKRTHRNTKKSIERLKIGYEIIVRTPKQYG